MELGLIGKRGFQVLEVLKSLEEWAQGCGPVPRQDVELTDDSDDVILCEDILLKFIDAVDLPHGGRQLQDAGVLQGIGGLMFIAEQRHKTKKFAGVFSR